jgi:hypothetical protein
MVDRPALIQSTQPTQKQSEGIEKPFALFVDDRELHRRMAPHVGFDTFRAAIRAYENKGFPKATTAFRGRYWPAVQAWLDVENGLANGDLHGSSAIDGEERF